MRTFLVIMKEVMRDFCVSCLLMEAIFLQFGNCVLNMITVDPI